MAAFIHYSDFRYNPPFINNRTFSQIAMPGSLTHAEIHWDASGQPLSGAFDDVYFSRTSGLEETRYVFLQHNQLAERWRQWRAASHRPFIIAETGFGTGLNFLCAWQLFEHTAPATARLHFISVEKYPLQAKDLQRALALWPELSEQAAELQAAYPASVNGFHRLSLAGGRIELTLLLGDAAESFSQLDTQVDAWFLDGFAPAKNPGMWTDALFAQLCRLSRPGTTFSTFTAAALVRRGLQAVGFEVNKVKGFGRKRHMLAGQLAAPCEPLLRGSTPAVCAPWYARPKLSANQNDVLVIGAGLAGATTAASLSRRGLNVKVMERESEAARGGSGNRQGVLYIKPAADRTPHSRLYLLSYLYALRQLNQLTANLPSDEKPIWSPCGVLQLAFTAKEQQRQHTLLERQLYPPQVLCGVDAAQASQLAGIDLPTGGLHFPGAGWVSPRALCHKLLASPGIELGLHEEALALHYDHARQRWLALGPDNQVLALAPTVVIANAADATQFVQSAYLPIRRIRGQTTYLHRPRANKGETTAPLSPDLRTVVCHEGYITPQQDGLQCLGATFNLRDNETALRHEDQQHNLAGLQRHLPAFHEALQTEGVDFTRLDGKVGFRCTSPDYIPIVGPVPDHGAYLDAYADLRKDATRHIATPAPYLPGLYLNVAHGSRGLSTAPLCAEVLSAYICNEPMPMERDLIHALHPARFIIRDLIRNKI